MNESKLTISARDGYKITAILREPKKPIKGVIQFNSGTGVPKEVYYHLTNFLSESGYATIIYDYRGIGESAPNSLKGFNANMRDWAYQDMTGIFDWVIKKYPNERKIIMGHSMGGQLVGFMDNSHLANQLVFIAASTGYWKDMSPPFRFLMPFIWHLFIPYTTTTFGYGKAKKIRQGEDLPKGVALEWRNWCTSQTYFEKYFQSTLSDRFFDKITAPINSIHMSDDPIANDITVSKILNFYTAAKIKKEKVVPQSLGEKKIGHFGYFSRRFKDSLWKELLSKLDNHA